ncbi:hypothetical protein E1H99_05635 [Enterococcus hirae]|nr:hypothetical protein E1H99_05635 [Enterococcus hirae]
MKLIKVAKILAVISGLVLYFIMSVNQFFLYFEMFALLILNGIRIFDNEKMYLCLIVQSNKFH